VRGIRTKDLGPGDVEEVTPAAMRLLMA